MNRSVSDDGAESVRRCPFSDAKRRKNAILLAVSGKNTKFATKFVRLQ
jgi:hypothetical protein